MSVEASFDDGATWKRLELRHSDERQWVTNVQAPDGAEFVSLRGKAMDRNGTTVEQKTIRAYGVR